MKDVNWILLHNGICIRIEISYFQTDVILKTEMQSAKAPGVDEEKPHVFTTSSRAKHSKRVSYPIGAEILSRALDGVPQHSVITCTFTAGNPHRNVGKEQFRVMHVHYRKRPRSFYDGKNAASRGVFAAFWDIWIYDVLVEHRADIRHALIETGLPNLVRPWLIANAVNDGKVGEAIISLEYNTVEKVLMSDMRSGIQPEIHR
jgi:hypothetical protein